MKSTMRSTPTLPLLLAAALLLPLGASAQATSPDSNGSTGQYPPPPAASPADNAPATAPGENSRAATASQAQSSIPARIKSEMAAQNILSSPDIDVESDATGSVVLSGTAQSQADIDKTMSIARGTTGVTSVRNDIKVKSQG